MATRGDLISRIIGDLHLENSSYTTKIETALSSAVDFYRPERFWFNEGVTSFILPAGSDAVTITSDIPDSVIYDTVQVTDDSGGVNTLNYLSWDQFQDKLTMTALPESWAVHHHFLYVWPTNNTTRSIEVTWSGRVTMTASNSSSCVWTNEAKELIRMHAEADLCENFLLDLERADRIRVREMQEYGQLISETIKRLNLGRNMKGHL